MARKKVEFTERCVVVFSPVSASRGILVAGRKNFNYSDYNTACINIVL